MTLALGALALGALALVAPALAAITSAVEVLRPPAQVLTSRSHATPSRRSSHAAGAPKKAKASPSNETPRPPAGDAWPSGTLSSDLSLIATNIPPHSRNRSTASLLDVKADRYLLVSPGDHWGEFEVVRISLDWVQLRRAGSYSWVSYREHTQRRTRAATSERREPPRRVRHRPRGPTVTYKWLVGRLNLYAELEEHLSPKVTAKGLQVGRVTSGFRRIGLRVGDVVQRAGDRPVRSTDDIREGLQRAARPGGYSSITVLRKGRTIELPFDVR